MAKKKTYNDIVQITDQEDFLRTQSKPVVLGNTINEQSVVSLGDKIYKLLSENSSYAGLAAVQIGELKTVFGMKKYILDEEGEPTDIDRIIVCYNPDIDIKSFDMAVSRESCLSIPKIVGDVKRYSTIILKYYDIHGIKHKEVLYGINAFIAQHEFDHLQGILFIDKMLKYSNGKK